MEKPALTSPKIIIRMIPANCTIAQINDTNALIGSWRPWQDLNACRNIDAMLTQVITAINSPMLKSSEVNASMVKNDRPITSEILLKTHCEKTLNVPLNDDSGGGVYL